MDAWGRNRQPNTWNYGVLPVNPTWLYRGYTGHEQLNEFNLINMNARLYDPTVGRMLSPDNYVSVGGSQGLNRYTYANNNPLKYTDPDGNFWHIVAGAVIGGAINVATHWNKIHNFGDGLAAFGIGAVGGAASAFTGGAVAGALGGFGAAAGAFYGAGTSGIIGGFITGGVGSITGGIVQGGLNALYFHDKVNLDNLARSVVYGAIGGAIIGGSVAAWKGDNIFTGLPKGGGVNGTRLVGTNEHRRALIKSGDWGINKYGQLRPATAFGLPATGTWADGRTFRYGALDESYRHISLGVKENLEQFSQDIGAAPWWVWSPDGARNLDYFKSDFLREVSNPNARIHFNMTLRNGELMNPYQTISSVIGNPHPNITSWELSQIWNNSDWFNRTTFYYQGQVTTFRVTFK